MAEIGTTKYNAGTIDTSVDGDTTDFTATIGKHYVIPYATGTPAANLVITLPATPSQGNAVAFTITTADATYHVDFVATINGVAYSSGGAYALVEPGDSVMFRYVDATIGWVVASKQIASSHASIFAQSNATATTISASSSDFSNKVQVTIFDTDGASSSLTPDHTNDHMTIRHSGDYELDAALSFSGGANDFYSLAFFKNNGATQLGGRITRKISSGGDLGSCSLLSGPVALSAGDTIELWIQNETATDNCTIEDIVFTAYKV